MPRAKERAGTAAFAAAAHLLQALADPTRLAALQFMAERGEISVSDLVELLAVPQGRLSDHLAHLRWHGFVATRRDGRRVYYRLAEARVLQVLMLIQGMARERTR